MSLFKHYRVSVDLDRVEVRARKGLWFLHTRYVISKVAL